MTKHTHLWTYAAVIGGAGLLYYLYKKNAGTTTTTAAMDPAALAVVTNWAPGNIGTPGIATLVNAKIPAEYAALADIIMNVWGKNAPYNQTEKDNMNFFAAKYAIPAWVLT